MRSVAVLGATGSIGVQALDVIAARPDLRACALSAHRDAAGLAAAARATGAKLVALSDPDAAADAPEMDGVTTFTGERAVEELIAASGADLVLNAIVGSAGLRATLAAFAAGADVALANKESLVAGGELVLAAQRASGRLLIPVDSEHSALAQCLAGAARESVTGLVITASGGPFRGRRRDGLTGVTAADALAHPTWSMGRKITIDSATLMNKGLEVIEGHHLFAIPYDAIEVVVHPQSIVHGMVRFRDGALLAHVGNPDMRVPISWALTHPAREATTVPSLDLASALSLDFEPVDADTFRCLALAREAGLAGGTAPCILNAANEVAVHAFLDGRIGFLDIAAVVEEALERVPAEPLESLEHVLDADRRARVAAAGAGAAAA